MASNMSCLQAFKSWLIFGGAHKSRGVEAKTKIAIKFNITAQKESVLLNFYLMTDLVAPIAIFLLRNCDIAVRHEMKALETIFEFLAQKHMGIFRCPSSRLLFYKYGFHDALISRSDLVTCLPRESYGI